MKKTTFLAIFIVINCHISTAQKLNKFYNKQDSIDFQHYTTIISKGYKFMIEDGEIKYQLIDSVYQNIENFINRDSAIQMRNSIPRFEYYVRHQNESYTKADQLDKPNQFDTITHVTFEGRDLKRLPVFKLLKCKNLEEIELVNTSVKKIPWLLNWSIFGLDSLETLKIYNHAPNKQNKKEYQC